MIAARTRTSNLAAKRRGILILHRILALMVAAATAATMVMLNEVDQDTGSSPHKYISQYSSNAGNNNQQVHCLNFHLLSYLASRS